MDTGERPSPERMLELRAYDVSAAKKLLERGLGALGETLVSIRPMRRNDPRKQALAWLIKSNTMAGDEWITRKLDMGHRSNVGARWALWMRFPRFCGLGCDKGKHSHEQEQKRSALRPGV